MFNLVVVATVVNNAVPTSQLIEFRYVSDADAAYEQLKQQPSDGKITISVFKAYGANGRNEKVNAWADR